MVKHMRYCTNMEKGDPNMADIANNCKKEVRWETSACGGSARVAFIQKKEIEGYGISDSRSLIYYPASLCKDKVGLGEVFCFFGESSLCRTGQQHR